MWDVDGKPTDPGRFTPFEPSQVLYAFDGPRIFTHLDRDGELCLACWSDEDERAVRFIVVPFSEPLVERLVGGDLSVRDALNQPRCWLLDVGHDGTPRACWSVRFGAIPEDALPGPGTMLLASLESRPRPSTGTVSNRMERVTGRIREVDKDRWSFELREIPGNVPVRRFVFGEEMFPDVIEALQDDHVVTVVGAEPAPGRPLRAVALSRSSQAR